MEVWLGAACVGGCLWMGGFALAGGQMGRVGITFAAPHQLRTLLPGAHHLHPCPPPPAPAPPAAAEHRRKKSVGNNHSALPRAVDPERSRTKERMQKELGEMGLDAVAASERAARSQSRRGRSLVRKRGRSAADAEMAEAEAAPQKRIHSSKSRCAGRREGWLWLYGSGASVWSGAGLPVLALGARIPFFLHHRAARHPPFYSPTPLPLQVDVPRAGAQHRLPRPQQGPQGRRAAQQVDQDGGCVGAAAGVLVWGLVAVWRGCWWCGCWCCGLGKFGWGGVSVCGRMLGGPPRQHPCNASLC